MSSQSECYIETKKVVAASVAVNIFLMLYKLIVGIVGHSTVVIADGIHSLSDLMTDMVVLIGVKYASKPEDEEHPYGHGKVETFASLVIAVSLVIVAAGIILSAYKSIAGVGAELRTPKMITLTAVLVSVVFKEILFRYTLAVGKKHKLSSLIANAWHHRSDAYSSIAAMAGVVGAMMGFKVLDPLFACVVALLIGKVGVAIGKDAYMDLIDTAADKKVYDRIADIIKETEGVKSYHGLKTRKVGNKVMSELQIRVDPSISVVDGHDIAKDLKAKVIGTIDEIENILIHVEPIGEEGRVRYLIGGGVDENTVRENLMSIEGVMGVHSLMVHCFGREIVLTVDVEVDPELSVEKGHNIAKKAKDKLKNLSDNLRDVVVHIDPFESID
jgi:cation diffusion facilitator family transporter